MQYITQNVFGISNKQHKALVMRAYFFEGNDMRFLMFVVAMVTAFGIGTMAAFPYGMELDIVLYIGFAISTFFLIACVNESILRECFLNTSHNFLGIAPILLNALGDASVNWWFVVANIIVPAGYVFLMIHLHMEYRFAIIQKWPFTFKVYART